MNGQGDPAAAVPTARGCRVAILASSWQEQIMTGLLAGARRAVEASGAELTVVQVPGSFELPAAAAAAARGGYDAAVALGVVILDGTPHLDSVCQGVTTGLTTVTVTTGMPVGFGILTVDTAQQAAGLAGLAEVGQGQTSVEDRGFEAAVAALAMIDIVADLAK